MQKVFKVFKAIKVIWKDHLLLGHIIYSNESILQLAKLVHLCFEVIVDEGMGFQNPNLC